jgi:hypothetical protein
MLNKQPEFCIIGYDVNDKFLIDIMSFLSLNNKTSFSVFSDEWSNYDSDEFWDYYNDGGHIILSYHYDNMDKERILDLDSTTKSFYRCFRNGEEYCFSYCSNFDFNTKKYDEHVFYNQSVFIHHINKTSNIDIKISNSTENTNELKRKTRKRL